MTNMKLFKKSERGLKVADMLHTFRECGYTTRHIGEWCRWKEIEYGRIQVKINVYEIKNPQKTAYMVGDTLGRVAAQLTEDKQDVMNWLAEHGYKTDKQWYIEDCGMDEDTWNEWNEGM